MSFWDTLFGFLGEIGGAASDDDFTTERQDAICQINPGSGLPMATGGGCSGVDVGGNPYGSNLHDWNSSWHHDDT